MRKRDLLQKEKRPTTGGKETYYMRKEIYLDGAQSQQWLHRAYRMCSLSTIDTIECVLLVYIYLDGAQSQQWLHRAAKSLHPPPPQDCICVNI